MVFRLPLCSHRSVKRSARRFPRCRRCQSGSGKPQSKGLVLFPGQASTDGLDKPVDDQRMLWPIPKTEMDANPQLAGQQNPGY